MEKNSKRAETKKIEKVLAIETSSKVLSVALAEWERNQPHTFRLLCELNFDLGLRHSDLLQKACSFLVDQRGWDKKEISLVAVTTGPGSFTGLRVGTAFARALAQSLDVGLIGIPVFEVIACGVRKISDLPLYILIESIGDQVFCGHFPRAAVRASGSFKVVPLPQLMQTASNSNALIVGDGFLRHQATLEKTFGKINTLDQEFHFPRARSLAELAFLKTRKKKPSKKEWHKVVPFYMRAPLVLERSS